FNQTNGLAQILINGLGQFLATQRLLHYHRLKLRRSVQSFPSPSPPVTISLQFSPQSSPLSVSFPTPPTSSSSLHDDVPIPL
ncbi:hypothetical protein HAX54_046484, partial [Datura stramonium]|nr:hypothetical protein [Datura stramonium]